MTTVQTAAKVKPAFSPGRLVATPGALKAFQEGGDPTFGIMFLKRHLAGDWGDLCDEDKEANDLALHEGSRLLSAYHTNDGTKVWVITEADRSATTFLLPDEY